jgi:hypothetical protein
MVKPSVLNPIFQAKRVFRMIDKLSPEFWLVLQAAQKDLRGEAREKSTSGGVLSQYVGARRLSNEAYESFSAACLGV